MLRSLITLQNPRRNLYAPVNGSEVYALIIITHNSEKVNSNLIKKRLQNVKKRFIMFQTKIPVKLKQTLPELQHGFNF